MSRSQCVQPTWGWGRHGVPSLALGTCCLTPEMPVTCPRSWADCGDQLKVEDSRGLQESGLQCTGGCGQGPRVLTVSCSPRAGAAPWKQTRGRGAENLPSWLGSEQQFESVEEVTFLSGFPDLSPPPGVGWVLKSGAGQCGGPVWAARHPRGGRREPVLLSILGLARCFPSFP